ncbi:hypothetical protein UFOVP35_5 [uncultured Caudovirales phage]|uniref:Uncharacterized protein n=1 Tax=uncultured Caudovirales phage TaxID=2100421 RepID=A0A6J7WSY0_9CAUD|nr:hypothetical protein UFOVP35_5 [uncultured Caudovirales phage]CAB4124638.1 hypothetical protein UFOVP52_42 [uncultured Caudovirales phage]CAB5219915.1 hypothetical protein UFOVP234_67 [uncultured Caudovirales phage]
MPYVGYSGVANQANTSDGFAEGIGAANVPVTDGYGENVGDGGVVDLYHNATPVAKSYILMESTGYVLQEDGSRIVLELS